MYKTALAKWREVTREDLRMVRLAVSRTVTHCHPNSTLAPLVLAYAKAVFHRQLLVKATRRVGYLLSKEHAEWVFVIAVLKLQNYLGE